MTIYRYLFHLTVNCSILLDLRCFGHLSLKPILSFQWTKKSHGHTIINTANNKPHFPPNNLCSRPFSTPYTCLLILSNVEFRGPLLLAIVFIVVDRGRNIYYLQCQHSMSQIAIRATSLERGVLKFWTISVADPAHRPKETKTWQELER